jgi:hypothetical protein
MRETEISFSGCNFSAAELGLTSETVVISPTSAFEHGSRGAWVLGSRGRCPSYAGARQAASTHFFGRQDATFCEEAEAQRQPASTSPGARFRHPTSGLFELSWIFKPPFCTPRCQNSIPPVRSSR